MKQISKYIHLMNFCWNNISQKCEKYFGYYFSKLLLFFIKIPKEDHKYRLPGLFPKKITHKTSSFLIKTLQIEFGALFYFTFSFLFDVKHNWSWIFIVSTLLSLSFMIWLIEIVLTEKEVVRHFYYFKEKRGTEDNFAHGCLIHILFFILLILFMKINS